MSAVEDVAAAIAEQVRAKGWHVEVIGDAVALSLDADDADHFCCIYARDASQAKRLAKMMRAPPAPVFDAMNLPELPAFPSIRGKA